MLNRQAIVRDTISQRDVISRAFNALGLALAVVIVGVQPSYAVQNVFTDSLNMSNKKIVNVTNPTAAQDAATKAYVDAQISSGGGDADWIESGSNVYRTSGNVGIGTSSPDTKLQVVGDLMVGETNTTGGALFLHGTTAGRYSTMRTTNGNLHIDSGYGGGGDLYLNWYSGGTLHYGGAAGTDKFSVTTAGTGYFSGNVGIGVTPTQKLHVSGNSLLAGNVYIGSTDSYFYRDAANRIATPDSFYVQPASPATYLYSTNTYLGNTSGDTTHLRGNNFTWNQGTIQGSGNVGIGTSSPSEKLHVAGNIYTPSGSYGSVDSGTVYINNPAGAAYNGGASVTGAIKITLPQSWSNTMMKMTVEVYDYTTNESVTIKLGGYNYTGSSWPNTFAQILASKSDRDYKVRFGHDGSKNAIWIGETNSTWSYPKVRVVDFIGSHSNATFDKWDDGWDVTFATSFGTVTNTQSSNLVVANLDSVDGLWDGNGTDVYRSTGKVGIGTTAPADTLDVKGNIRLSSGYPQVIKMAGNFSVFEATSSSHITINKGAWANVVVPSGNVGIATNSPSQKLEVNGNIKLTPANPYLYTGGSYLVVPSGLYVAGGTFYAQNLANFRNGIRNDTSSDSGYLRVKDSLLADSWLRTSGATGWYSQSYGGGLYMADSTWIRTYGNKGFYHNTGIMRTDGTFQVGNGGDRFIVNSSGYVGIGDNSPSYRLELPNTASVAGRGRANAWYIYSDGRFKTNVKPIDGALDKVLKLDGVYYQTKPDADNPEPVRQVGFIAQDVEKVFPDVVSVAATSVKSLDGLEQQVEDYHSVDYARITALLTEAIKEQQAQIEGLMASNAQLVEQVQKLGERQQ